jgi:hypothetical protein
MTAMTPELQLLALSIVLGLIQIVMAWHAASLQRGLRLDGEFSRRGHACVDRSGGPTGAVTAKFVETFLCSLQAS